MHWGKEEDRYRQYQEMCSYYKERMARNPWERGEYIQEIMEEYQQAIMDYNETVDFQEYVPRLSEFDMLILKGKITDRY